MFHSFRNAAAQARQHGDLYFAALVDRETIMAALGEASSLWQGWVYCPAVTVWVFLSQCLSPDHSCREAVARLVAWRVNRGLRRCSSQTGAYCTARDALPEKACQELVRRTGRAVEVDAPAEWQWHGRRVRVVDGSTLTMPDTPENQAEYPQAKTQQPGCGLPIARIQVVFSLAVGTVLETAAAAQHLGGVLRAASQLTTKPPFGWSSGWGPLQGWNSALHFKTVRRVLFSFRRGHSCRSCIARREGLSASV